MDDDARTARPRPHDDASGAAVQPVVGDHDVLLCELQGDGGRHRGQGAAGDRHPGQDPGQARGGEGDPGAVQPRRGQLRVAAPGRGEVADGARGDPAVADLAVGGGEFDPGAAAVDPAVPDGQGGSHGGGLPGHGGAAVADDQAVAQGGAERELYALVQQQAARHPVDQ